MPASLPLTLRDCLLGDFRVIASCDHCQLGRHFMLEHLVKAAGPAADRPLLDLFDAGKLICARCSKPWAGLTVERSGDRIVGDSIIIRLWRPGSRADPAVAGYLRGVREERARTTKNHKVS